MSKWVSSFCLTPNEQFLSYSMARTSYIRCNDDDVTVYVSFIASVEVVEQELLTLPEHLNAMCMLCRSLFFLFFLSFVVCFSSIYGFWLPLWYLQTLLIVRTWIVITSIQETTKIPKIGKNMIFWRKIVIFHTKNPKNFAPPSASGKKFDFLA